MIPYNPKLNANAKALRKNMTPEERHLWYDFLKRLPLTVKRQHVIENYIVDFYIAEKKIVIEIDGLQHKTEEHIISDNVRDTALSKWGIRVLRYENKDVQKNFIAVTENILSHLDLNVKSLKPL